MRIDEEECDYFAVTGLSGVDEFERLDLMLVVIGESDTATCSGVHRAKPLDER